MSSVRKDVEDVVTQLCKNVRNSRARSLRCRVVNARLISCYWQWHRGEGDFSGLGPFFTKDFQTKYEPHPHCLAQTLCSTDLVQTIEPRSVQFSTSSPQGGASTGFIVRFLTRLLRRFPELSALIVITSLNLWKEKSTHRGCWRSRESLWPLPVPGGDRRFSFVLPCRLLSPNQRIFRTS